MQEAERKAISEIEEKINRLHARILFVQAYPGIHEMDHFSHIANNILSRAVISKDRYKADPQLYGEMVNHSNNALNALRAYLNLISAYEEFRHGELSSVKGHFEELELDSEPEQYVWEAKK